MSALAHSTLTPEAARVLTDEVKADAAALWAKLLQLYDGGAHLALGYSSWGSYYSAEFGQSGNYGYRLLKSAEVMEQLPNGNSRPSSEAVARELVPVLRDNPERVEEVWAEVVQEHGPEPTAAEVRKVVQRPASSAPAPRVYMFKTELRLQHEAPDQATADAWTKRLVQRLADQGVITVYKSTRSI